MQTSLQIKLLFVAILLVAILTVSDGQFFTKTGSKSIPRMGRRADNSLWSLIPQYPSYKRKIVESLLNKYNEKNGLNSDNSESKSSTKIQKFDPMDIVEDDLTENISSEKNDKPQTASLQADEESDNRFNTNSEVRKLQKILTTYIDKTQNGL